MNCEPRWAGQYGDWVLLYYGDLEGRHEFIAKKVIRRNFGSVTLEEARAALIELAHAERGDNGRHTTATD